MRLFGPPSTPVFRRPGWAWALLLVLGLGPVPARAQRPPPGPVPARAQRPPPGLVIDGVDYDRPYPGKFRIPSHGGVLFWAPNVSGTFTGPNTAEIEGGSAMAAGVHGRFGRWSGEIVGASLGTALEMPFLVEGLLFAPDSQVDLTTLFGRVTREITRFETATGRYTLGGGIRLARFTRSIGTAVPVVNDPLIPSPELSLASQYNVGGHFGVHTRTSYARGQGGNASTEVLETRAVLNYHVVGAEPNTLDLAFGLRYLKERIRFRSDMGFPSTQGTFTFLGPEVSLALRF